MSPSHNGAVQIMTAHPRITLAPDVLVGKPVIRGTRLSVEFVIGLMAEGWSESDILKNYAAITHDDIIACLAYARDSLGLERVFPSAAWHALSRQREFSRRSRHRPGGSRARCCLDQDRSTGRDRS